MNCKRNLVSLTMDQGTGKQCNILGLSNVSFWSAPVGTFGNKKLSERLETNTHAMQGWGASI